MSQTPEPSEAAIAAFFAALQYWGWTVQKPTHGHHVTNDLVRALTAAYAIDFPAGSFPHPDSRLAASLLCELGYATDPRLDGLQAIDVREVVRRPQRAFSGIPASSLTDEQVAAVLAEYRAALLAAGAPKEEGT